MTKAVKSCYIKIDLKGQSFGKEVLSTITDTFSSLKPEKQAKIINAAFKEFAEQGYDHASTNRIVKEAGIAKGLLFYYFKSKKDLFHYLIEYGANVVVERYVNKLEDTEPDFIERHKHSTEVKMTAIHENPYIFSFLGSLQINQVKLPDDLAALGIDAKRRADEKRLNNIDKSLFRDDVNPDLIFKLICWALEEYERELIHRLKGQNLTTVDYNLYRDEFYDFLADLKKVFYKRELKK